METTTIRVLLATVPVGDVDDLCSALLDEHLIACANVISPLRSIYWWKGTKEESVESLLLMKTGEDLVEKATARIVELHPYEVPEVIVLPVVGGHKPYLDWVVGETR